MLKKLNNKGDTLVVVLIGIFVLSILGTLILGVTATNLSMKANENKNQKTFYYAEKATDELYAGIGKEVMGAVHDAYNEALEYYVQYKSASIDPNAKFVETLNKKLVALYDNKTFNVSNTIDTMLARFNTNNYVNAVTNYTFDYSYNKANMDVKFYKKSVGTSGYEEMATGDSISLLSKITITNVGVKCTSDQGYTSSVVTDFDINIPEFNIDFTDSATEIDLQDLLKYSLICQGGNLTYDIAKDGSVGRTHPAIVIDNDSNVTISGNLYADGTAYAATETTLSGKRTFVNNTPKAIVNRNNSIQIKDKASLRLNSKIINCFNDITLGNKSNLVIRNRQGDDNSVDTIDTMQLFANNIITNEGTSDASVDIVGNMMLKDDLQINGDNSTITLKGNYFGYGFRDDDNDGKEDKTGAITGFVQSNATTTEHERSSAIVINGTGADLDMYGLSRLVLAGRAYIDLDASGKNTSYMTGESISFKGNQKMYLADTELSGSKIAGNNPIDYWNLLNILGIGDNQEITYSMLGLANADSVVAKKIREDSKVYFYVKNEDPADQTNYFINQFNTNNDKKRELKAQVKNLGVKQVSVSGALKSYTAGAFMQVGTTLSGNTEVLNPQSGENGISESEFKTLLTVIQNRLDNLTPALKDVSETYILGQDTNLVPSSGSDELPFDYIIDREKLYEKCGGGRKTYDIDLQNLSSDILTSEGLTTSEQETFVKEARKILDEQCNDNTWHGKKFGFVLSCETGTSNSSIELDAGVVITDSPYKIDKDFVGLIICNGTMTVSGNVDIKASEELGQLLFTYLPSLREVLRDAFSLKGQDETGAVVNVGSLNYTDMVDKSNWRKDNR